MNDNKDTEEKREKEERERRNFILDLYKSNLEFLTKVITGGSIAAFPIILNLLTRNDIDLFVKYLLLASIFFFLLTLIFQIMGLKFAASGCDFYLSKEADDWKEGEKYTDRADRMNSWRNAGFVFAFFWFFAAATAIVCKEVKGNIQMTDYKTELANSMPIPKAEKRSFNDSMPVPKAEKRSFTLPKPLRPQGGQGSSGGSSDGKDK